MLNWLEYTLCSLSICLLIFIVPGQVFLLSINEGMKSIKNGFLMLLGVITAELSLIALLEFGAMHLLNKYIFIINIAGAIVLIWLGLSAIHSGIRGIKMNTTQSSYRSPIYSMAYYSWLLTSQ